MKHSANAYQCAGRVLVAGLALFALVLTLAACQPIQAQTPRPAAVDAAASAVAQTVTEQTVIASPVGAAATGAYSVTVQGGDEAALRDFLSMFLAPLYPGAPSTVVTATVGTLPTDLPLALDLPPEVGVVGSVEQTGEYGYTQILLRSEQPAEAWLPALRSRLAEQGFTPAPAPGGGPVFRSTEPESGLLCGPDDDLAVDLWAVDRAQGGSQGVLRLSESQRFGGPCQAKFDPGMGPEAEVRAVLPVLDAPPGVMVRGSGSSSGGDMIEASAEMEGVQDIPALAEHFGEQLAAAGWTQIDASATEDLSWSAWTRTEEGPDGDTWVATFYIVRRADLPDQALATLRAARR